MTSINVTVSDVRAKAEKTGKLTVGMVGVPVCFSFDETWEGLKRIAVFRCGNVIRDRALLLSDSTTVPYEVLYKENERLWVGVEGRGENGELVIPTTWAEVGVVLDGANATGREGDEASPNAYDDIMAAIKSGALRGPQGPKGDKGDPAVVPPRDISTGKLTDGEKAALAALTDQGWLGSKLFIESNNLPGFATWAYGSANVDVSSYLQSVHKTFGKMFDTANKASNGYKYQMLPETEDNRLFFAMLVPGSYGGGTAFSSHGYRYTMAEEDYRVGDLFCSRFTKKLENGSSTDKCYYMALFLGAENRNGYTYRRFLVYIDYGDGVAESHSVYITDYTDLCALMGADTEIGTPIYYFVLRPENIAVADTLRVEKAVNALGKLTAMPEYLVNYDILVTKDSKTLDQQIDDILWEIFDKNRENASAVNAFVSVVCDGAGSDRFSLKAGGNRWMMLITKITSHYARVLAWCTGSYWVRSKSNGVWGPWCQENPAMECGFAYCTTERYDGKPVYTKLVNCGAAPTDFKSISHGLRNFTPIRSIATMGDYVLPVGFDIPSKYGNYHCILTNNITINNTSAYKGLPVKVQIWYIKK